MAIFKLPPNSSAGAIQLRPTPGRAFIKSTPALPLPCAITADVHVSGGDEAIVPSPGGIHGEGRLQTEPHLLARGDELILRRPTIRPAAQRPQIPAVSEPQKEDSSPGGIPRQAAKPRQPAYGKTPGGNPSHTPRDPSFSGRRGGMTIHRVPAATHSDSHARHNRPGTRECSPQVEGLIRALRRAAFSKRSVEQVMDDIANSEGVQLSKGEVGQALTELQRRNDWRAALNLFGWMKRQVWFRHSSKLYTELIGFLGRNGQSDLATSLFQEMLLERQEPNHYTYTALIVGYGRAAKVDEALEVFHHMKTTDEPNCSPNAVTCNALIGALCKLGLYDKAVEIFFDMREPRNGLTTACRPNIATYNTLISALCREGQMDAARKMLTELRRGHLDAAVKLNVVSYNTIVSAFCGAGRVAEAEEIVRSMQAQGFNPDNVTYTELITMYGKTGLVEKAEETFEAMRAAGLHADVWVYTALIDAFGRAGLAHRAEALFAEMKEGVGSRRSPGGKLPEGSTTPGGAGRPAAPSRSLRPSDVTYLKLIDMYGKLGVHRRAEELFQEMQAAGIRPNVFVYSALLDAYGKAAQYGRAATLLAAMRAAGCRPNLVSYAALLGACSRCRAWEDALRVLYGLQAAGDEGELAMCRLIMGGPGETTEPAMWRDAERMFDTFKSEPLEFQRSFYNALIGALWSFRLRGRAARVMELGRERNVYDRNWLDALRHHRGSTAPQSVEEWSVDFHGCSVGAALALLYTLLREIQRALQAGAEVPPSVRLVTGWGRHSKRSQSIEFKEAPLKAAMEGELQLLGSPFTEMAQNTGSLLADGGAVRDWLLQPQMEKMLELSDSENPRPIDEQPYEAL